MKPTALCVLIAFVLFSCKKQKLSATVIKDCTGTYLRYNDLDHAIGNESALDDYSNLEQIEVAVRRDDKCVSDRTHCMTIHDFPMADGRYRISCIKK